MGTNFFWLVEHHEAKNITLPTGVDIYRSVGIDHCDPNYHLGKRSAAGAYCWDCNRTLCRAGEGRIHYGRFEDRDAEWSKSCLTCGKTEADRYPTRYDKVAGKGRKKRQPARGSMVELGFDKPNTRRPKGVGTCCSFSWAQDPTIAKAILRARKTEKLVEDEYGQTYTGAQFLTMLRSMCPVEFTNSIGSHFS